MAEERLKLKSALALAKFGKHVGVEERVTAAILTVIARVPESDETESGTPDAHARMLAGKAAKRAAAISGGAALAPGPIGMLTLLPDLLGVWKVQAQMVADIAGTYGKSATLTQEQMLYCLFKHLISHGLRDIVVRAGERYVVQRATSGLLPALATKIGIKVTQRGLGTTVARYAPVVGALGVAAYAYCDTTRVAKTAVELFSMEIVIDGVDGVL